MKKDVLQPKNFVMLTIAGLINAFGVTCFLYPVNLYDSGISGTSMLLAQVTPGYLSLSVFLLLLNFPLFYMVTKKWAYPLPSIRSMPFLSILWEPGSSRISCRWM